MSETTVRCPECGTDNVAMVERKGYVCENPDCPRLDTFPATPAAEPPAVATDGGSGTGEGEEPKNQAAGKESPVAPDGQLASPYDGGLASPALSASSPSREEVERLADDLECSTAPIKNQAARMLRQLRRERDAMAERMRALVALADFSGRPITATYLPKADEFRLAGTRYTRADSIRLATAESQLADSRRQLQAVQQDAARWQFFRRFLSVEQDIDSGGQFLFIDDDSSVSFEATFQPGYEHTVESLVDAAIARAVHPQEGASR